ncbi:conserved hypothetical protein [Hahella chejuensis KCTC 2396]|uniref:Uncharacterized protein n=1 Tax=Hahella chejuensis (strain KCTC 2396) TaxID=349521 RepID=Q2SQU2_HAHCH|nr:hypothetical protein [Hahella chejuensis]ABC26982.1 conserved hypothetical protein [Hahella chejuensis KCTC 2396]
MQPQRIAWSNFLLPVLVAHAAWLWSSLVGAIDGCLPYWDGCVSISKAARSSDALYLFRAGMIIHAVLLLVFWFQAGAFLKLNQASTGAVRAMQCLGAIGALFLVLYADFLGVDGRVYRLLRQYGVTIYFSFTVLAQMLLLRSLLTLFRSPALHAATGVQKWLRAKTWLCWWMLALGLASVANSLLLENPAKDRWENVIEWFFALSMTTYFAFTAMIWRRLGYRQRPHLDASSR